MTDYYEEQQDGQWITWGGLGKFALAGIAAVGLASVTPATLGWLGDSVGTGWLGDNLKKAAEGLSSVYGMVVDKIDTSNVLGTQSDLKTAFGSYTGVWDDVLKPGSKAIWDWFTTGTDYLGAGTGQFNKASLLLASVVGGKWLLNKISNKSEEVSWREREDARIQARMQMAAAYGGPAYGARGGNGGQFSYGDMIKRQQALQQLEAAQGQTHTAGA